MRQPNSTRTDTLFPNTTLVRSTHYLNGAAKAEKRVEQYLSERFPSASITSRNVAVIAILGRDLRLPGLGARALTALAEAGIEPLGFNAPPRKVDMQVIVEEKDHHD